METLQDFALTMTSAVKYEQGFARCFKDPGPLELEIGSLESKKIIIRSLESGKSGNHRSKLGT